MRLRNVPGAREMIAQDPYSSNDEDQQAMMKGHWQEHFGDQAPLHIEIGMGKGRFLMTLAAMNPDINYVGIEKYSSVLVRAMRKQEQEQLSNVYFLRMEAENLTDVFDRGEVSRIYLNFSDPWPKDRHAKRRLTSRQFWDRYDQILVPDGRVIFKTDNRPLFDFSLEEVRAAGWELDEYTFDLHEQGNPPGNIMTEYEEKFVSEGKPICRLIAHRNR